MLAADLQESSESDHTSEAGTGEGSDLAGTGSGDLAGGASGRSGTRAGGVVTLTTVSGLASRVDGDHGRVVALAGVAGLTGVASRLARLRARDRVRVMFIRLDIHLQSNLPVVADNSGGGEDRLGDGARAVSDGQGSGLSDGVGLVAVNDLSGTGAVGGVSSNDLGGVGNVLGVGGNASSESESSSELHFEGWVFGFGGLGIRLRGNSKVVVEDVALTNEID